MYCSKCGHPAEPGQKVCASCGAVLFDPRAASPQPAAAEAGKKTIPDAMIILIVVIALAVIGKVFSSGMPLLGGSKYSSEDAVVDAYAEALENADAEKLLQLCFPKKAYEKLEKSTIDSIRADIKFINSLAGALTKKDSPEYEMEISLKVRLDADSLNDLENYFSYQYGVSVSPAKGYAAEVKMKIGGSRDSTSLNLYYLKDEGWKITPKTALDVLGRKIDCGI